MKTRLVKGFILTVRKKKIKLKEICSLSSILVYSMLVLVCLSPYPQKNSIKDTLAMFHSHSQARETETPFQLLCSTSLSRQFQPELLVQQ